jgi:signal peptidase I
MTRNKNSILGLRKYPAYGVVAAFFCAVVIFCGSRYSVVRVDAGSMENALFDGDWMLQDRSVANLQRGDVVTFQAPWDHSTLYVKRVIAVSGDSVAVCAGELYLDGQRFAEPYVRHAPGSNPLQEWWPTDRKTTPGDCRSNGIHVPPESIFVMGDNRDASTDSRIFGAVPLNLVTGRVWLAVRSNPHSLPQLRSIPRFTAVIETAKPNR